MLRVSILLFLLNTPLLAILLLLEAEKGPENGDSVAAGDGGCDKRIHQVCYDKSDLDTVCVRTAGRHTTGAGGHDMGG